MKRPSLVPAVLLAVGVVATGLIAVLFVAPRLREANPSLALDGGALFNPPLEIPASGLIRIGDEEFAAYYNEIHDKRDLYLGREIELAGYVLHRDDPAAEGFLVGRDLMWCCPRDKYFIGFLAFFEGSFPSEQAGVRVRGVLEAASYRDPESGRTFTVPAVRASLVEPTEDFSKTVRPR